VAPVGIRRILIVDDDPQAAQLLSAIMRMVCDEVVVATTLRECFSALQARAVALVVLDLFLPDSNGHQTIQAVPQIKAAGARRVVAVTGMEIADNMRALARENGVEELISKNDPQFSTRLRALFDAPPSA
jgi:CheY-like chemotaxis protein